MLANEFATGGEVEHEVRSTFQLFEGYLCKAFAGHYDWRDTLFRYRDEARQDNRQQFGSTFSGVPMCVLKPLK